MPAAGRRALDRHLLPAWWSDAKLGIFVHWTPASVPGWAPVGVDVGELTAGGRPDALAEIPYTEWYENSLRFPDSPVSRHHAEAWPGLPYRHFAGMWEDGLAGWDPDDWARRFAAAGARWVVLVAKHHDGWCLWPSAVANPRRRGWHSRRDVVGELREAVLAAGLRFGLYYSGGLDWTFDDRPVGNLGDMLASIPRDDYPAYADAQVRELVARYRPSVLWNDIAWPGTRRGMFRLMAHYYAEVPDGVLNDRWMPWSAALAAVRTSGGRRLLNAAARASARGAGVLPPAPPHFDVRTPEYTVFDEVPPWPWECVRGMDHSFGYNRNSRPGDFLDGDELTDMLSDIVAKGGNLLLNVGPRGEDAAIPTEQAVLLEALGRWTAGPGRSVYGSRPWAGSAGRSAEGHDLRYWAAGGGVHVAVLDRPGAGSSVTVPGLEPTPTTAVLDASGSELEWEVAGGGLRITADGTNRRVITFRHVTAAPNTVL